MLIGVPRERKDGERRVALLPAAVRSLAQAGHRVRVEQGAGTGIGLGDGDYARNGAELVDASAAWGAELVVKVKEVLEQDLPWIPHGATLFGFQQLVGYPQRTRWLAERGMTAIAFELVRDASGELAMLGPMSTIAGRMGLEFAVGRLAREPRGVLVLGFGHAGRGAAEAAARQGARVVILTRSQRSCDAARAAGFEAEVASPAAIERHVPAADIVVGAVLVVGQPTPKLVPRALVRRMRPGSVIADVCIDGGGVAETSRPTSHSDPTYVEEGVVHYCVPNIPGAAPEEAAAALSAAALPYVHELAARGLDAALRDNAALRGAVMVLHGAVIQKEIAAEAGLPYNRGFVRDLP